MRCCLRTLNSSSGIGGRSSSSQKSSSTNRIVMFTNSAFHRQTLSPEDISFKNGSSSKSESTSSSFENEPFGSFLFLMIILFLSWFGEGRTISPSSYGLFTRKSPRISWKSAAILRCWDNEQWFSMERISGYGEVTKALFLMTTKTSLKLILEVRVCPW